MCLVDSMVSNRYTLFLLSSNFCRGSFVSETETVVPPSCASVVQPRSLAQSSGIFFRSVLCSWEFYLVIAAALFFRLYAFDTTEFDVDEARFFHMASNAVANGYVPATSNLASVKMYSPPAIIYLLMPSAMIANDPMGGALTVAILSIVAVICTYIFVRFYYGRVAGTIAALAYATLLRAAIYSRFIWNPNLLQLFVVLFMAVLLMGVVSRRKGWLWMALILWGWNLQLHASCIYLAIPLAVAFVLAPGTFRWRDALYGGLGLLIIYAPYIVWEVSMMFIDVRTVLQIGGQEKIVDGYAWQLYQLFLHPYAITDVSHPLHWKIVPFLDATSWLSQLPSFVHHLSYGIVVLVGVCIVWSGLRGFWPGRLTMRNGGFWRAVLGYWRRLRASPYRSGLLVLFSWQVVPLLLLIRHDKLHLHYLIFLLPGPCILLGIGLGALVKWACTWQVRQIAGRMVRYGAYTLALVVILVQAVGTTMGLRDLNEGRYSDGGPVRYYYNDLRSLENAVEEADQAAQTYGARGIYVAVEWHMWDTMRYLGSRTHTPTTVADVGEHNCVVLPDPELGPAIIMVGPYNTLVNEIVRQYTQVRLIGEPVRAGGAPFQLYLVEGSSSTTTGQATVGNEMQFMDIVPQTLNVDENMWTVSQWRSLRNAPVEYRRIYHYDMTLATGNEGVTYGSQCVFNALRTGDRVIAAFDTPDEVEPKDMQRQGRLQVRAYEDYLYYLQYGPLTFQTDHMISTPAHLLRTEQGDEWVSWLQ